MKGIYLGACRAYHPNFDLDYCDINPGFHVNIVCDMLTVDLSQYDFIIATPPCNFWTKANPYYLKSSYSLSTKHLLPSIIEKCALSGKPFIVENVRNLKRFKQYGILDLVDKFGLWVYIYGRHTYFTNVMFNCHNIPQKQDFLNHGIYIGGDKYRQGGENVYLVLEHFMNFISYEM